MEDFGDDNYNLTPYTSWLPHDEDPKASLFSYSITDHPPIYSNSDVDKSSYTFKVHDPACSGCVDDPFDVFLWTRNPDPLGTATLYNHVHRDQYYPTGYGYSFLFYDVIFD